MFPIMFLYEKLFLVLFYIILDPLLSAALQPLLVLPWYYFAVVGNYQVKFCLREITHLKSFQISNIKKLFCI